MHHHLLHSEDFASFVQVSAESAYQFGELVADPVTHELLHYTEKPETFVSMTLIELFYGLFPSLSLDVDLVDCCYHCTQYCI